METVKYCPQCGTENSGDAAFCRSCGSPVGSIEEQQSGGRRRAPLIAGAISLLAGLLLGFFLLLGPEDLPGRIFGDEATEANPEIVAAVDGDDEALAPADIAEETDGEEEDVESQDGPPAGSRDGGDTAVSDPTSTPTQNPAATATATPSPAATPTATATPSPTPSLTPMPSPSPLPSATASNTPLPASPTPLPTAVPPSSDTCNFSTLSVLSSAWNNHRSVLNCPTGPGDADAFMAVEDFQSGRMIWRSDTDRIYVLFASGGWSSYADTWVEGQAEYTCGTPSSPPTPRRGFGKVWCDHSIVQQGLGNATNAEWGENGAVQDFAGGSIIRVGGRTHILYSNGTWR